MAEILSGPQCVDNDRYIKLWADKKHSHILMQKRDNSIADTNFVNCIVYFIAAA